MLWLQHFASGWDKWEEKAETTPCSGYTPYAQSPSDGAWHGRAFGSQEVTAEKFRCVSVMGFTKTLVPDLLGRRSVLVEHLEVVMHDNFGGLDYWSVSESSLYMATSHLDL